MRHKQFQDHTATSSSIVKYQAPNGVVIDARIADGQVWLTYEQVASLFDVQSPAVIKHVNDIVNEGELQPATTSKLEVVRSEGNRSVNRNIVHINQEMVLHIGYRVRDNGGLKFRNWATDILMGRSPSLDSTVKSLIKHAESLKNSTFSFGDHVVRTYGTPENPMFCAVDVCKALDITNVSQACATLDSDERDLIYVDHISGAKQLIFVNEPGLYALISGSRKPEARAFKRWVHHDVLPAIRRTGSYTTNLKPELSRMEMIAEMAYAMARQERETARLRDEMDQVVAKASRSVGPCTCASLPIRVPTPSSPARSGKPAACPSS